MPDGPHGEYRRRRRTVRGLVVLTGLVVIVDIGALVLSIRSTTQTNRARSTVTAVLLEDHNLSPATKVRLNNARRAARDSQAWANRAEFTAYAASGLLLLVLITLMRAYTVTEHARRSSREAQLDAERLSTERSLFLSRVSHELRTPLGAILGFGQMLEREPLPPIQREALEQMLTGARHLTAIVNDLLDLSRFQAGELRLSLEPVRVRDAITEARSLVAPDAVAAAVGIRVKTVADDLHVQADHNRLQQVLLNLLSNAVKYNRRGGNVVISAIPSGGRVRIEVTDTGIGIPAGAIERLATPFERLDAARHGIEGTGLGLAVARGLVEAMSGTFGLVSQEGVGTTVWIDLAAAAIPAIPSTLVIPATPVTAPSEPATPGTASAAPASAAPASAAPASAAPGSAAPGSATPASVAPASAAPEAAVPASATPETASPTPAPEPTSSAHATRAPTATPSASTPDANRTAVLYIEDNHAIANLVQRIFTLAPELTLQVAAEGAAGLALAREQRPDLILLDLHLPDQSGEQVLAALLADPRTADIPVLIVSAEASSTEIKRLRAAGAAGYITKPFQVEHLLAAVRSRGTDQLAAGRGDRDEDVLDSTMVRSLHALADNPAVGPAQLGEMLATFRLDAGEMLDTLHAASRDGDREQVARQAHRLAGGAGAVGAGRLRLVCRDLESAARQARDAEARTLEEQLDRLLDLTWNAIGTEFAKELAGVSADPPAPELKSQAMDTSASIGA